MPRRSFLVLEVIAGLGLSLVLALLLALAVTQYAAARRENDARRLLRLTAEAELARIRAGVAPLADQEQNLAGDISLLTIVTPGTDDWRGLCHVRVTARQDVRPGRRIAVELRAFVDEEGQPR